MPEKFDRETRRRTMRSVPSRDTSLEIHVRRALHAAGFRFRLHRDDLPGKPDLTLPRFRTVVFVHGCFWHGHGCKRSKPPVVNAEYWRTKIDRNVQRDQRNQVALCNLGWTPHVIWECQIDEGIDLLIAALHEQSDALSTSSDRAGASRHSALHAQVGEVPTC
ncbi:MAG: very short patch repair endonuclease [Chloroflexi bacterium]|nr:MAG: very short patch repair endonuclease [Chloroflexota bacterium]